VKHDHRSPETKRLMGRFEQDYTGQPHHGLGPHIAQHVNVVQGKRHDAGFHKVRFDQKHLSEEFKEDKDSSHAVREQLKHSADNYDGPSTLYRGVHEDEIKHLRVGDVHHLRPLTSASSDRKWAEEFSKNANTHIPKQGMVRARDNSMIVFHHVKGEHTFTGQHVSPHFDPAKETVLHGGTKWRVHHIDKHEYHDWQHPNTPSYTHTVHMHPVGPTPHPFNRVVKAINRIAKAV
jgi:hypothetical protein